MIRKKKKKLLLFLSCRALPNAKKLQTERYGSYRVASPTQKGKYRY